MKGIFKEIYNQDVLSEAYTSFRDLFQRRDLRMLNAGSVLLELLEEEWRKRDEQRKQSKALQSRSV